MSVDWTRFAYPGTLETTYRFALATSDSVHALALRECHNDFARVGFALRTIRTITAKGFTRSELEARRIDPGKFHNAGDVINWISKTESLEDDSDVARDGQPHD